MSSICTHTHTFVKVHFTEQLLSHCSRYGFHFGFLTWSIRLVWSLEVRRLSVLASVESRQGWRRSSESVSIGRGQKICQVIIVQAGGRYMGFLLLRLICRADSTGSHRVSGMVGAPSCLQRGGAPLAGSGGVGSWWPLTAWSSFSSTATLRSKVAVATSEMGVKCLL